MASRGARKDFESLESTVRSSQFLVLSSQFCRFRLRRISGRAPTSQFHRFTGSLFEAGRKKSQLIDPEIFDVFQYGRKWSIVARFGTL